MDSRKHLLQVLHEMADGTCHLLIETRGISKDDHRRRTPQQSDLIDVPRGQAVLPYRVRKIAVR